MCACKEEAGLKEEGCMGVHGQPESAERRAQQGVLVGQKQLCVRRGWWREIAIGVGARKRVVVQAQVCGVVSEGGCLLFPLHTFQAQVCVRGGSVL
jgi:hypothetical protein